LHEDISVLIYENCLFGRLDSDRSKKLGFDEYIQSDPCKFDHHDLFRALQTATLDYRLNDPYCSLVNILNFFVFSKILI
jgi:hypothetical protein